MVPKQEGEIVMKSKTLVSILVGSILLNISTLNNYTVCANSELASTTDNIETIKITSEAPTPLICDTSAYTVSVQRIFYEKGNYSMEFMIENHSDQDLNFGLENTDVDNFQVTIYSGGSLIYAGKKGIATFHFREQNLTEYGINDFQTVNTVFSTFPFGTGDSYPLQIQKDAFSRISAQVQSGSEAELSQTIKDLKQQVEDLKKENASLKKQLADQNSVSDLKTSSTGSDNESAQRLTNATIFKADVYNGAGTEIIGKRAYIIISKDTLKQISEKDYADFLSSKVKDSGYNWFSIICDDGTGICFAGSFTGLGTYGKINNDGSITEAIGNISATEQGYEYEPIN